jgi:hypothetical protein
MPAGEDADERVEVHGHHRVSGDQYSVSAPIQADVAGSVPGAVNSLPAGEPWYPSLGIECFHHGGQVRPSRDLP